MCDYAEKSPVMPVPGPMVGHVQLVTWCMFMFTKSSLEITLLVLQYDCYI